MKIPTLSITVIIKLIKFFTSWKIEEIASRVEFVKRDTGLKASTFLKTFTAGVWDLHEITLDLLAEKCCESQYGLTLTKQALFKRLKAGSMFLKELLAVAVTYAAQHSIATETIDALKQFKNVYICDSTLIDLPDKLENIYRGIGSPNPKATLKLQVIFSLLEKKFKSIEFWTARGNDINYNSHIVANLSEGDLVIYDLGYFSMATFKEIKDNGAHFLSRFKLNTSIYREIQKKGKHKKESIHQILSKSTGIADEYFYIGARKDVRTEVRLVAVRLPENVVNERRRKATKKAKSKGTSTKKAESELLAWNIIVTDVPENMLCAETILQLYKIRWQIELVFKNWKSHFNIGDIGQAGADYFHCILYGKLILITLMTMIYSCAFYMIYHKGKRILSSLKFFKTLREKAHELHEIMDNVWIGLRKLSSLLQDVIKRSITEKRNRKTTEQALAEHPVPVVVLQNVG